MTTPTNEARIQDALAAADRMVEAALDSTHWNRPAKEREIAEYRARLDAALCSIAASATQVPQDADLRYSIGRVISDALTGDYQPHEEWSLGFDPFDSREIDAIADKVMALLPAPQAAPQGEPVASASEDTRMLDFLERHAYVLHIIEPLTDEERAHPGKTLRQQLREEMAEEDPTVINEPAPIWKHKNRGTLYTEVGRGKLQVGALAHDMADCVIYRGDDGALWVRPTEEFEDGRFERINEPSPAPSKEQTS